MAIDGFTEYAKEDREKYNNRRWWLGITWGDMFNKATDIYPDKIGLVDEVGKWTYSQLRGKVNRLAISFMKHGIKPQQLRSLPVSKLARICPRFFRHAKDWCFDSSPHPTTQSV